MVIRSAKWTKFLEKCPLVRYISIFWALPGAHAPGRVHSPFKRISIWLVETEIAFSVEEQHFIGTTAGQIEAKRACGFSKKYFTKS